MFFVLLRFSGNKDQARQFMQGHKDWLQQGFDDGVFLVAGSLQPHAGGAVLAHDTSLADLQARVASDPFVENHVVSAEVLEVQPSRTDDRLEFLLG